MGRCREFKHEEALEKAMYLFWEKGYENTSLKELLKEMNILNGSFYNCFKNKKNLFLMALDHYTGDYAKEVMSKFDETSNFKESIRELFDNSLRCEDLDRPAGCFLVNCAASELMNDPEVSVAIKEKMDGFYSFIESKMVEAIERGEISKDLDPKATTDIALSYLHGRMNMKELFPHNETSKKQIDYLLSTLGI